MHISQKSYKRCSFVVALILFLILILMAVLGFGPSFACCVAPIDDKFIDEKTEVTQVVPLSTQVDKSEKVDETPTATPVEIDQPFSFVATQQEVTHQGASINAPWMSKTEELKALLSGEDLRAKGDAQAVTLSGLVESESIKQQKFAAAQAFFGSAVTVNNQLVVKAGALSNVASQQLSNIQVYFATNRSNLDNASTAALLPLINWLNEHIDAKVVVQGYHDATGNPVNNALLAKKRAQVVYDHLLSAGITAERLEIREAEDSLGSGGLKEARRVEVSVK